MYAICYNGGEERVVDMLAMSATEVRKNWSTVLDEVREKPQFVKRTHDFSVLMNTDLLNLLLDDVKVLVVTVCDGNEFVVSSADVDIVSSGNSEKEAIDSFISDLMEYCQEFYDEFDFWSSAPNRKSHIPIVLKVCAAKNKKEVENIVVCQNGQN